DTPDRLRHGADDQRQGEGRRGVPHGEGAAREQAGSRGHVPAVRAVPAAEHGQAAAGRAIPSRRGKILPRGEAAQVKFKVLRMVKRRAGESREDFAKRWHAEHPKSSVVTLATGEIALGGAEAPFDGMSATYFATEREARAAATHFSGDIVLVCDEHLMSQKANPQLKLKIVRTVYRRRDLTHQQFKD